MKIFSLKGVVAMEDGYEYKKINIEKKNGHYSKKTILKGGFYERTRNNSIN